MRDYMEKDHVDFLDLAALTVLVTSDGDSVAPTDMPLGAWLHDEWIAGRALLVVDGLDQEPDEKARATALLKILQPGGRVLMTSRPFAGLTFEGIRGVDVRRLELQDLEGDEQVRQLLEKREAALASREGRDPDSSKVSGFLARLAEDVRVKSMARRPGHLVVLNALYRETGRMPRFLGVTLDQIAEARLSGRTLF